MKPLSLTWGNVQKKVLTNYQHAEEALFLINVGMTIEHIQTF